MNSGKYLKLINSKIKDSSEKLEYNVLKIQFPDKFNEDYEERLFKKKTAPDGEDGLAMKLAKELTDLCIYICSLREKIKTSILQFEFVGTKRIASDILRDFFLENYTLFGNDGYLSDSSLDQNAKDISGILKPLSTLLGNGKDSKEKKLEIGVVEYYDNTKYLNIESDLGKTVIGQRKVGEAEVPSYYIDSNNLIASSLVSQPIYEDIVSPCASFIKDYNKKFWSSTDKIIGTSKEEFNDSVYNDYEDFYAQYVPEYEALSSSLPAKEKIHVKDDILMPLLEKAWSEFALSRI